MGSKASPLDDFRLFPYDGSAEMQALSMGFDLFQLKRIEKEALKEICPSSPEHSPLTLQVLWKKEKPNASWNNYLTDLRFLINQTDLDDPEKQRENLAVFIEIMVERFEYLVEQGEFDAALPKLRALPALYSPSAGKGASSWARANQLFRAKSIASQSWKKYRIKDSPSVRNPIWADLGDFTLRVVNLAAQDLPRLLELRKTAKAFCYIEKRRPRARKACRALFYILEDDDVLVWPDWLNCCAFLPKEISQNPDGYKTAASAVLGNFFADPNNQYAEEILHAFLQQHTYPQAVNEARKAVLNYIAKQ